MSEQATLWDIPSVIGSPESGSGVTHSGSPDGQTTDPCGPAPVRAPALAQRAKGKGLQMLVTSGLSGIASSASAALQSSLESRLLPRLDTAGSTLFVETWKRRVTPLRRRYWEHTARAPLTSGSGCTSVPTPTAEPANGEPEAFLDRKRRSVERGSSMGIVLSDLQMVSKLATVATPRGEDSQCTGAHRGTPDTLRSQANLATVTSPSARDWKDTSGMSEAGVDPDGSTRSRLDQLPRQAQLADSGRTATGGPGATGSGGQLDPAYSRWLMAVPPEWDDFACLAMQSVSKRPKPSSKHTSTRKDDHGD
jgi:hypothetical protein